MPGRKFAANNKYRYGFNGKEDDNEVEGEGNEQDYGMRIYDPRVGRFLSVDPLQSSYPWYTPYQFAGNKPIWAVDLDGLEEFMKTQENLLRERVRLQQQAADSKKRIVVQQALQAMSNQPTVGPPTNNIQGQQLSNYYQRQYQYNETIKKATMDPLAGSMIFPAANAVGQYANGVVDHAVGAYQGFKEGNFWEGTKNTGLLALDVLEFIPFKGIGTATKINSSEQIFTKGLSTRGFAEDFALNTYYKGYQNANKVIQKDNPIFDLFDKSLNVVDVTTTSAKTLSASQFNNKLARLASLDANYGNRTLQIYVKSGQYTTEQITSLSQRLQEYITDFNLQKTSFKITAIK